MRYLITLADLPRPVSFLIKGDDVLNCAGGIGRIELSSGRGLSDLRFACDMCLSVDIPNVSNFDFGGHGSFGSSFRWMKTTGRGDDVNDDFYAALVSYINENVDSDDELEEMAL